MGLVDLIANNQKGAFEMLKWHLSDFTDADLLVRPVPAANHAAWQVGHLATLDAMLCGLFVPSVTIDLPANADKTYGKEGASSDDASRFLKKDAVLALLGQGNGALVDWMRTLTEADLARPAPEKLSGWVKTVGELVMQLPSHTAMHVGQIQVIRRKLGKPILF